MCDCAGVASPVIYYLGNRDNRLARGELKDRIVWLLAAGITASKRIDSRIEELPLNDIEIKEFVRDTDLTNLRRNVAYRMDGVHLYADILNLVDMLHVTEVEGETCHRRTLRFLNMHYRAVYRILLTWYRVEFLWPDRLGEVAVHACRLVPLPIVFHCVCGHTKLSTQC